MACKLVPFSSCFYNVSHDMNVYACTLALLEPIPQVPAVKILYLFDSHFVMYPFCLRLLHFTSKNICYSNKLAFHSSAKYVKSYVCPEATKECEELYLHA